MALCDGEGKPYVVPLNFGLEFSDAEPNELSWVWLHMAHAGRKLDILRANPRVALSFVTDARVVPHAQAACSWSMEFASIHVQGTAAEVADPVHKRYGLGRIMAQYAEQPACGAEGQDCWVFPDAALAATNVWRVAVEQVAAKISPASRHI